MTLTIGKRIANLRQQHNWTQQELADRAAISRVAVSHIEMGLSIPGERTIALLAGIFKLTPDNLVMDTTYPQAKAERLPLVVCSYTPLEVDLKLMENDLRWVEQLENPGERARKKHAVIQKWTQKLQSWSERCVDPHEKKLLLQAQKQLRFDQP